MKIFNVKTAIAAVCVVAAGFGGVKAYDAANQSDTGFLLAENVEALSSGEGGESKSCYNTVVHKPGSSCWYCGDCTFIQNSERSIASGTSTCYSE